MSVKIAWAPSSHPYIASYDVEVSTTGAAGSYAFLANVVHAIPGAAYDASSSTFFYNHAAGALTNWYRLVAVDTSANRSTPSAPIEPVSTTPTFTNTVKVDHNYGSPGALRYQTAGGAPIEQAIIRVYTKAQFDQGETGQPLAITMTDARGNWATPVSLTAGFTYTIVIAKEGLYGPNAVEIVV